MIKYVKMDTNTINSQWSIYFTAEFYNKFHQYYNHDGSYFNILYRVFGILPQDFYHMAAAVYNASFILNPYYKKHVLMVFKNKNDGERLCKEINTRLSHYEGRF